SPEFKKSGAPPTMGPALRRRLAGSEIALTVSVICGVFLVIPGLSISTFTRVCIDDYLVRGQQWMVSYLMMFMIGTFFVQGVLTWLQKYYLLRLESKLALSPASPLFHQIPRIPSAY